MGGSITSPWATGETAEKTAIDKDQEIFDAAWTELNKLCEGDNINTFMLVSQMFITVVADVSDSDKEAALVMKAIFHRIMETIRIRKRDK